MNTYKALCAFGAACGSISGAACIVNDHLLVGSLMAVTTAVFLYELATE